MRARRPESRRARLVPAAVALAFVLPAPAHGAFEPIAQFGGQKPGELIAPIDVERDNAGNTYVVDALAPAVHKYDAANNHVLRCGSFGTGPGAVRDPDRDRGQRGHRRALRRRLQRVDPADASDPALRHGRQLPRPVRQHRERRGPVRRSSTGSRSTRPTATSSSPSAPRAAVQRRPASSSSCGARTSTPAAAPAPRPAPPAARRARQRDRRGRARRDQRDRHRRQPRLRQPSTTTSGSRASTRPPAPFR